MAKHEGGGFKIVTHCNINVERQRRGTSSGDVPVDPPGTNKKLKRFAGTPKPAICKRRQTNEP